LAHASRQPAKTRPPGGAPNGLEHSIPMAALFIQTELGYPYLRQLKIPKLIITHQQQIRPTAKSF
jgi:hypothetical protein